MNFEKGKKKILFNIPIKPNVDKDEREGRGREEKVTMD
jgi:hypothetical protein